jgi:hypothetical protein
MEMLNWMQDFTENATGWTRRSQGVGASGLQQQTATGMNIITNRDDMRLDLIIRNLADGIKDIFNLILKNVTKYQDKEDSMRIAGNWVPIDPREWKNGFDLNINVGLGTNNKEQQAQHLMGLMNIQKEAIQIGVASPENIYNAAVDYAKAVVSGSGERYFTDPKNAPPQPPQPNPDQMKIQADQQKFQAQSQLDIQKYQAQIAFEREKEQMQMASRQRELELEAQKQQQQAALDMQERQHQAELQHQLEQQRLEFDRWKAQLQAETQIIVAEISAKAAVSKQQDDAADMAVNDEYGEQG